MSILAIADVQAGFPQWESFVKLQGEDTPTAEARLQRIIDDSDAELLEFVTTDTATISAPLKLHLMNIIRKRSLDVIHGNASFEHPPQIIKDYERTLDTLARYQAGLLEVPAIDPDETSPQLDVSMSKPTRKFDSWFSDQE